MQPFNGNPDSLRSFCSTLRQLLNTYGPKEESTILLLLANKFTDRAAAEFGARLADYRSIERLIEDLTLHFSSVGAADKVWAQVRAANRHPDEPATEYGSRFIGLQNHLLAIYDSDPNLEPHERNSRKKKAAAKMLQHFFVGLRQPLEHRVRIDCPKTLEEAVRRAVEHEHIQNTHASGSYNEHQHGSTQEMPQHSPLATCAEGQQPEPGTAHIWRTFADTERKGNCNYCRGTTHVEADCRKKRFDTQKCDYCRRPGHVLAECLTLRSDIRSGRIKYDNRNQPSSSNLNRGRCPNNEMNHQQNTRQPYRRNFSPPRNNWEERRRNDRKPPDTSHVSRFFDTRERQTGNSDADHHADTSNIQHLNSQDARRAPQASSGQSY